MEITSAVFMRGLKGTDPILEDGVPQIAFMGRSNVGKSTIINMLTRQGNLARTSPLPGKTQELNVYLINGSRYLIDLPGYAYAKAPQKIREKIQKLVYWFLFESPFEERTLVFIIDAEIGPTKQDLEVIKALEAEKLDFVVVANKIDKIRKSSYKSQIAAVQKAIGAHQIIPLSAEKKIGRDELLKVVLGV